MYSSELGMKEKKKGSTCKREERKKKNKVEIFMFGYLNLVKG